MEKIVYDFRTYLLNESKEELGGIRLFCDMDGVLTDFDRGFKRLKANEDHLKPKDYEKKHGKNSIWPLIDHRGIKFWKRLPWKSDGRELWDYIHRYSPIILSAPSRSHDSVKGKLYWLKLNLGINEKNPARSIEEWDGSQKVILTADKGAFAESKNDILIDDRRSNIDKWTEAGGTGILHNDSTDTIRILESIISKLKGESEEDTEPEQTTEPENTEQNEQPEDTQNSEEVNESASELSGLQKKYPNAKFTLTPSEKFKSAYFARLDIVRQDGELEYLGALKGPVDKQTALDFFENTLNKTYDKYY